MSWAEDRELAREKQQRDERAWQAEEDRLRSEDEDFAAYYILTEMDKKDEDGSSSDCFVTTAAYGDPFHPMVKAFRALRDEVLVNYKVGRALTAVYNKVGPVVADFIRPHPLFCKAARAILTPTAHLVLAVRGKKTQEKKVGSKKALGL